MLSSLDELSDGQRLSQLNSIEIDIVREKLRHVYEQLTGATPVSPKVQKANEVTFEMEQTPPISSVVVDEFIQQSQTDPAEIESEQLIFRQPEKEELVDTPPAEEPDLFSVSPPADPEEAPLVIDKIAKENADESVADKIKKQAKVESLKDAIGINEKFFLINELFDGNLSEYNKTIGKLDEPGNRDEALKYLDELAANNAWEGNHEAVKQLQEFVERKFM